MERIFFSKKADVYQLKIGHSLKNIDVFNDKHLLILSDPIWLVL